VLSRLRRTNPTALAAAIFAALSLLFVAPALLPGRTLASTDYLYSQIPWSASPPDGYTGPSNTELYDPAFQFTPWLEYVRAELPGSEYLWNPHMAAGRPLLGNMQSGVFSPFSLPGYLLPMWWSWGLVAALKLFLACFGTYLLARRLGQSFAGSLLAGAVYGFGLYQVVHLLYPLGSVYVLIPWMLLAVHGVTSRPGVRSALPLAVLVALSLLAGHPESAFHAVLFVLAYGAFRVVAGGGWRGGLRPAAWVAGAGMAGAALAAIVLIPFTELLALSADFGNREGLASTLPTRWLRSIALPEYFGRPTDSTGGSVELGTTGLFIARAIYAGALPLMLASVAGLAALRRGGADVAARRFLLGTVAVCLGVIYGLPGLFDVVRSVPVLGQSNNTRFIIVYLLALALLAGFGLDDLIRAGPRLRRASIAVGAAVLLIPVIVVLATAPPPGVFLKGVRLALGLLDSTSDVDVVHARSLFWWVLFALAGLLLLAARARGRVPATAFAALALALVCADLFRAGVGFNPAISQDTASLPETPAIRYLRAQRPARFVAFDRGLAPNQAMRYGLYDARNYDFPIIKRYDVAWRRYVFPLPYQPGAPQWVLTLSPSALRVLGLLGVSDVLVPTDEAAYARRIGVTHPELGLGLPGLDRAYDGADGRIYRLADALPRAFVVHAQRVVRGEDESLRELGDPEGADLARVAVTQERLPGVPVEDPGAEPPRASPARIVSYSPQRVVLDAEARAPGLAVLSDIHYPGWKAVVNGREAEIEQVDYMVRGVPVPAGRSRIVLTYEPASFRAGWIISVLALMALGVTLLLLRRRPGPAGRPA
jgi:hypothetical protein